MATDERGWTWTTAATDERRWTQMKQLPTAATDCTASKPEKANDNSGRILMKVPTKLREPQLIYSGSVPKAVILDIAEYRKMLELLEDLHDIREVEKRRKRGQHFRPFDEYLAEQARK
jgi:hypothetical protein